MSLAYAPSSFGFGSDGHRIVARIAENRLSVSAKREVRRLLGSDDISSTDVPIWADQIRNQRPLTKPWHFVDRRFHIDPALRYIRCCCPVTSCG